MPEIKRRTNQIVESQQIPQQSNEIVAITSRKESELEREVEGLKNQHEELQNIVKMLVQQNKNIAIQNKSYLTAMGKMQEKYRRKIQSLMLLIIFGKNAKTQENSEFLFPPQFENMLNAFEQLNNNNTNPYTLEITNKLGRKRRSKNEGFRMIKGVSSDVDQASQHGELSSLYLDKDDKEQLFNMLKDFKEGESQKIQKKQQPLSIENGQFPFEIPPSPRQSIRSLPYIRKSPKIPENSEWDDYLDRLNHSDYSQAQMQKKSSVQQV